MSWIKDFFDRIFSRSSGGGQSPIIIDIPPAVYYKELAVYNCVNFIGNAVARSEIKTFENGKKVKKEDYFRLNISPNINENASFFWHKVISKMAKRWSWTSTTSCTSPSRSQRPSVR